MPKSVSNLPEFRLFFILGAVALAWHLLTIFGSFLSLFADIFVLLFLSYLLAFILEPAVNYFVARRISRIPAAAVVYLAIAILLIVFIWIVLPTTITQVSQIANLTPLLFPPDSLIANRLQTFLTNLLANSAQIATSLASTATGVILIFILSFYILISRKEISKFIKSLVPDEYENDYLFIEKVINTTFASFLRIQIALALIMGTATFFTLSILGIEYALSTSLFAALLAAIPAIGTVLMFVPIILATLTISLQKTFFAIAILILVSQLVYNLLAPKLFGAALKIHPIVVLVSFLAGYKVAGSWGAIFAVPVAASVAIITKELLKYWQSEANKN